MSDKIETTWEVVTSRGIPLTIKARDVIYRENGVVHFGGKFADGEPVSLMAMFTNPVSVVRQS